MSPENDIDGIGLARVFGYFRFMPRPRSPYINVSATSRKHSLNRNPSGRIKVTLNFDIGPLEHISNPS
jgi:hypothetical protein